MYKVLAAVFLFFSLATAHAQGQQAMRPAISGISHVTFYANDFSQSSKFYAGLLGWEQLPAGPASAGVRFYANHLQYVELISPPQASQMDRLDGVAFLTANADKLRTYLSVHGISVPTSVTIEKDGSRSFLVHDPEGNKGWQPSTAATGKCFGTAERPYHACGLSGA